MKQRRLRWLVSVMCVLVALRVVAPSTERANPPTVAEAIVRKALVTGATSALANAASPIASPIAFVPALTPVDDLQVPGNAFALRPPPPPPVEPPPEVMAEAQPVMPPPVVTPVIATDPPAPPMPFQVIGTWDDRRLPVQCKWNVAGTNGCDLAVRVQGHRHYAAANLATASRLEP